MVAERLDRTLTDRDLYAILGISRWASRDEVRRAYRRLIALHHPDRHRADRRAERRTALINVAAGILLDPAQRAAYDRLRTVRVVTSSRSGPRPAPGRGPAGQDAWSEPRRASDRATRSRFAGRLRSWPQDRLLAFGNWSSSWQPQRHWTVFVACIWLSMLLIQCARPRSLPGLFGRTPAPGSALQR